MNDYVTYYGLTLIALVITLGAQFFISSTYSKYKKVKNKKELSGSEAARMILDKNGLEDVYVVETKGHLTDHYDPSRKVIRLSTEVFHNESIASVAVAAHECGHALQDKQGYTVMRIRSFVVPFVNIASYVGYFAIMIGVIASMLNLVWLGILMEVVILIFQIVTLPVEFDASRRALEEVDKLELLNKGELESGRKVLASAAMTYVASVLTAILELLRLILVYTDRD